MLLLLLLLLLVRLLHLNNLDGLGLALGSDVSDNLRLSDASRRNCRGGNRDELLLLLLLLQRSWLHLLLLLRNAGDCGGRARRGGAR